MKNLCNHFAKTGIKLKTKHTPDEECRVCPLRKEGTGDCIKDIIDNYGEGVENEISEIWRCFYDKSENSK